ncbi:SH3 domain-containing protein [Lysinibacillus telephonicus]|uniref:SH3 domain-containing protein n=1 Tax=Lysinibacillus telephonicus TaxID=1714840 RepID=A0A3S0I387_9BACI|nr:SH3 domain-containing protein [Lysinibacillus telephonicus]RTQ94892.1 SH3 domain-containing protein [Lysinibacillus telephonicus]
MKKLLSTLLIFVFVLFLPSLLSENHSVEAANKTMYVNAKNDIILRAEPSKDAKRLGTIKNHSAVTVLSSAKGWSYVQSSKTKGYVYTSALSNKKPAPTTITEGLAPKDGLKLTYSPSILSNEKETFIVEKDEYCIYLLNTSEDGDNFCYPEKDSKLTLGLANTDWSFFNFTYPMKQGGYIKDIYYDDEANSEGPVEKYTKVLVESTTKTIKVKAGSFKNVVILRLPSGERYYFAKGIGLIKATNRSGNTVIELYSVK